MLIFTALQWLLCINCFPLPAYLPPCVHADECAVYLIYIPALARQRARRLGLLPLSRAEIAQAPGGGHFASRRAMLAACFSTKYFTQKCVEWTGGCLAVKAGAGRAARLMSRLGEVSF